MRNIPSATKVFAFRLKPKEDVKKSLLAFAENNKIKAACIVTAVGSLEQLHLRLANQKDGELKKGYFEVVSLTGTLSDSSCHLHLAVSDGAGQTIGGHLLEKTIVYTTMEIVVAELSDLAFHRELDPVYGYQELVVEPLNNKKSN
jgi:uncharacterized protein